MTNYADIKDDSILKYEGTVILSIEKNGKIYETFVSHNKGRWPLFYCIAASLAGNYEVADLDRPKFIRLFTSVPSTDNNDNEATLIAIHHQVLYIILLTLQILKMKILRQYHLNF